MANSPPLSDPLILSYWYSTH